VRTVDDLEKKLEVTPPIGTIMAFGGAKEPGGYLICDGREIDRKDYSALFDALGETWGKGDGTKTFNIPDLRGEFLRGADNMETTKGSANVDVDKGRKVGAKQLDALQDHYHEVSGLVRSQGDFPIGNRNNTLWSNDPHGSGLPNTSWETANLDKTKRGNPRYSSETRPRNVAVLFIIKAK
jgi:microcystin-dependent protein